MTRDEYRAKCIEAMARELCARNEPGPTWQDYVPDAIAAFDSLNGIARVDPIDATEEMRLDGHVIAFAESRIVLNILELNKIWRAMSTAGDLTNAPEKTS